MTICFEEPTLDELLRDPLTRLVMHADGVDTTALKDMMRVLATEIAARPKLVPSPSRKASIGRYLRLIVRTQDAPSSAMPDTASRFCGAC